MGASLVYGLMSTDGNGFRLGLETLLSKPNASQEGHPVTMLGTQRSGSMPQNHHEAYLAITIDSLSTKIAASGSYSLNPSIILLNVGVNDCWYRADDPHPEDSDPSIDPRATDGKYTALRFGTLLSQLQTALPQTLVLASQLTYNTNEWQDACIQGFNAVLPSVVANATAQGQLVRYVEMYDAVPHDMYREDGTHPDDEGYLLMAGRWAEAVERAVGEVCGGRAATMDGVGEGDGGDGTASVTASGTASRTGTADGSEATSSERASLTVGSGAGALATREVFWPVLPLAAWALMG